MTYAVPPGFCWARKRAVAIAQVKMCFSSTGASRSYNACMLRVRFSLRTLLVVTALIAVLLVWIEWNRRIVHERQSLLGLGWNRVAYWYLVESSSPQDYRERTESVVG